MKSKTLLRYVLAVTLFLAGFFAHSLYLRVVTTPAPVPASIAGKSNSLEHEIRSLNDQLAAAQTENALLQSQLAETPDQQTFEVPEEGGAISFTASSASGVAEAIEFNSERMEEMMSRQVDRQLDVYAARLNLNDEQRAQLKEIMLMRMTQIRFRFGPDGAERTEDDNGAPLITQSDIDNLAADILSPEQLYEYDEMRAQEQAARSEMMATAQLTQIAPQLGLSEEQKDRVYSIYYEQSLGMEQGYANPQQMQESQAEADALIEEVLDEGQREVFRAMREGQSAFGNFTIFAR